MSPHQTTPLLSSYDDLPSLAFSSSPLVESPRTVHNRASRFLTFPHVALPAPESLTDTLASSPPDFDFNFGAKLQQCPQGVQVLGPSACLTERRSPPRRFKNEATRRLSDILQASTRASPRTQSSLGSWEVTAHSYPPPPAAATTTPATLGKRKSIEQVEIAEEYSIMGSDFGFLVDTTGHVRLSPLLSASKKRMSLTREQILNLDSDSENEDQGDNVEHNAVGEFARILTRSRLDSAERVSASSAAKPVEPNSRLPSSNNVHFYDPSATAVTPRSQGSMLAGPSTPLSTANFQANIMTPPGAMFSFDHPMYSTGLTPYLPRS